LALASKQFDEAEKISLEGINLKAEYIDLYYLLATLYDLQGKYTAAIKYFEEYLRLIRKFDNLKLSKNHNIQFYFLGKVNESKLKLSCLYLRVQDYTSSLRLGLELVKAKDQYPEGIDQAIANFVEAVIKSQDNKKLIDFYVQLTEREERICFLNNLEINKRSLEENRKREITGLFTQEKDSYAILNQIRIGYGEGRLAEVMKKIQELATTLDFNDQPDFYSELLFYLMHLEQKFADIICNITKEKAEQLIIYLLKTQDSARDIIVKYIFEMQDCNSFQELRFCKILLKNNLLFNRER
jgi:tetratricopeptide (TPR) repeat protein